MRFSTFDSSDAGRDPVAVTASRKVMGGDHDELSPRSLWESKAGRGSAHGSSSNIAGGGPTWRNVSPPSTKTLMLETTKTDQIRSLGMKHLDNIHVVEAMWFVFSQNASQSALAMNCDDDCLTKANVNHTCGKVMDVLLLVVGAMFKLTEQKCWKRCHSLPTH